MKRRVASVGAAIGLPRLARWVGRHRLRVLTYHGVLPAGRLENPFLSRNVVAEDEFERQMRHLVRHYRPIALSNAVDALRDGRPLPTGSVSVTFDDGFRNNYRYAYPVLRRYGIPATIFLTTGHVGGGPAPLWSETVALMLAKAPLPSVSLDVGTGRLDVSLAGPVDRAAATRRVVGALKRMPLDVRDATVEQLAARLGLCPGDVAADEDRYGFLGWDEVREMARGGVEFGSHTVSHAILSTLTPLRRRAEIEDSKAAVEANLGRPCRLFAYPNGTEADFEASDGERLAAAGYTCAMTQIPGLNDQRTDPFAMRRLNVGQGHHGVLFDAHVSGLLPLARGLLGRVRRSPT